MAVCYVAESLIILFRPESVADPLQLQSPSDVYVSVHRHLVQQRCAW